MAEGSVKRVNQEKREKRKDKIKRGRLMEINRSIERQTDRSNKQTDKHELTSKHTYTYFLQIIPSSE